MSFFDDAEETRQAPRRSGGSGAPPRGPAPRPRTGAPDVRRRQLVAGAVALVFLIIVIIGIKSCSDNAAEHALRNYASDISSLAQTSDRQVSRPLFSLLSSAGSGNAKGVELQTQINNLRSGADEVLTRAQDIDVPGKMTESQRNVLLALELRRDGVAHIAEQLQSALSGTNGSTAVRRIAGEMRNFDAADVIWSQRVIPLTENALRDGGVSVGPGAEQVASSVSLRDAGWLDPTYVAGKLGTGGGSASGPAAPGTHGHGLIGVSVGTTSLNSGSVNRLPATPSPIFMVKIQNQGENDETNVRVRITLTGAGSRQVQTKTLPTTSKGQQATASISLPRNPSVGSVGSLKAEVLPVAGEKKTDNNSQTFQVLFTR